MSKTAERVRRLLPTGMGGLAGLACALCCAIPILLAAGVLGGAGWATAGRVMPGIAVALATAAGLAYWWTHRVGHDTSCAGGKCSCAS